MTTFDTTKYHLERCLIHKTVVQNKPIFSIFFPDGPIIAYAVPINNAASSLAPVLETCKKYLTKENSLPFLVSQIEKTYAPGIHSVTSSAINKTNGKNTFKMCIDSKIKETIATRCFSWPNSKLKSEMLSFLTPNQRKLTTVRKSKNPVVQDSLFKSSFFKDLANNNDLLLMALAQKQPRSVVCSTFEGFLIYEHVSGRPDAAELALQNPKVESKKTVGLGPRPSIHRYHYNNLQRIIGEGRKRVDVRQRIAFFLLFLTGLRLGELLTFRWKDVISLLKKNQPFIIVGKGDKKQKLFLTGEGKKLLQEIKTDFERLKELQPDNLFLFSNSKCGTKPLSRVYFTTLLNRTLKLLSAQITFPFTTRSFIKRWEKYKGSSSSTTHDFTVEFYLAFQ